MKHRDARNKSYTYNRQDYSDAGMQLGDMTNKSVRTMGVDMGVMHQKRAAN